MILEFICDILDLNLSKIQLQFAAIYFANYKMILSDVFITKIVLISDYQLWRN